MNMSFATNMPSFPTELPKSTKQLIIVTPTSGVMADVMLYQKSGSNWQQVTPTIKADVGSKGIAAIDDKVEGDHKTPSGLYPLKTAYGTLPLNLKIDYKHATDEDKFVDDPNSPEYNTWVTGDTTAQSYEEMLREDGIYKIGVVINYNMAPIIPGKGSAIFMHIWYGPNIGTTGCIAMDEPNMIKIVKWLNKKNNPYIWIKTS